MKANIHKVGAFYLLFVLLGIVAIARIIDLQFIHVPRKDVNPEKSGMVIESTRGSIMATDGRLLAFSIPEFKLTMDPFQPSDTLFNNNIDALCDSLANFFGERKASDYKKEITTLRNAGRHYFPIVHSRRHPYLTYDEMIRVSAFPILNKGQFGGGLISEIVGRRQYPFGYLAYSTLGRLRDEMATNAGIEVSCDSILKGKDGFQPLRRTEHRKRIEDFERRRIDAVNGTDVRLTLDIDIQEIADNALRHTLAKSDQLEAGTVIILETSTGKIRALANLMKQKDGSYFESFNYAIGRRGEPGSVFKLATLCTLLEDGKVHLDDILPGTVNFKVGKRTLTDHYLDNYSTISILHGFEISSNNVFRMLAYKHYCANPQEFVDKLNNERKISYNYKFDINGFARAHINSPSEKGWSPVDLAQIGMGYASNLTPMHTVCFYNAIANGGVMVKPHLIESFEKDGLIIKTFPTEVIDTVCSPATVRELHRALRGVVENGTGKLRFDGCKVAVAGKTGTARIVMENGKYEQNGLKRHQATFAGFFPYENPKYTVIAVVYTYPTAGNFYGATWGGPVVREIAEEIYAKSPDWNDPVRASGKLPEVADDEDLQICDTISGIPDVRGLSLRKGVNILEGMGYKVEVSGKGIITDETPVRLEDGNVTVKLTLKETQAQ